MRLLLIFLAALCSSTALVNFSHSALYDVYDYDKGEVHIDKCDNGCVIYASIMTFNPNPYPEGVDPYSLNLYIYDNNKGSNIIRFVDLARQKGKHETKAPLTIEGPANISIINKNNINDEKFSSVLYVVEKETADSIPHELYDVESWSSWIGGTYKIITIMSAIPFHLDGHEAPTNFSVSMRLAGFDNALDDNADECAVAFQTTVTGKPVDPAFSIDANSPIISLKMENWDEDTHVSPWPQFDHEQSMKRNGFITTPGWNGCANPHSGGIQTFRSPADKATDVFRIDFINAFDQRQIIIDVLPHFGSAQKLSINDGMATTILVNGSHPSNIFFPSVNNVTVSFESMSGSNGFLLQYTTDEVFKPSTTPTPPAWIARDSYCNCGMTEDGTFDGWHPETIWVDLVIIIDTSTSMADRLEEVKTMLTTATSSLNTDKSAEFYSGIGIIDAADTAKVIYNLNMTSSDNLDAIKPRAASTVDFNAAFSTAMQMFDDGRKVERIAHAQEIVYYLSNSDAQNPNLDDIANFKQNLGIFMVNVLNSDEGSVNTLKSIASDHYFFTELNEAVSNLVVFCEANCFCNPHDAAFNDDEKSARTAANRGCFKVLNGDQLAPAAQYYCETLQEMPPRLGARVSIHDAEKEFFVNSVVSAVGLKKKYWLGLDYNGTAWNWDDQTVLSPVSFADWDVGQPKINGSNPLSAYAVQTTGLNVRWTAAEVGVYAQPTAALPVCETAPCSAGNKDCCLGYCYPRTRD